MARLIHLSSVPDGRFVAYRSFASNLVPGDSNGVPDIFLYDRNSGATTQLTANQSGNASGANRSANPFFSADGQTLVFQSAAYDLVTNDFNRNGDVFAVNLFAAGMIPVFYVQAIPRTSVQFGVHAGLAGVGRQNLSGALQEQSDRSGVAGPARQYHDSGQYRLFHDPNPARRTTLLLDRGQLSQAAMNAKQKTDLKLTRTRSDTAEKHFAGRSLIPHGFIW